MLFVLLMFTPLAAQALINNLNNNCNFFVTSLGWLWRSMTLYICVNIALSNFISLDNLLFYMYNIINGVKILKFTKDMIA